MKTLKQRTRQTKAEKVVSRVEKIMKDERGVAKDIDNIQSTVFWLQSLLEDTDTGYYTCPIEFFKIPMGDEKEIYAKLDAENNTMYLERSWDWDKIIDYDSGPWFLYCKGSVIRWDYSNGDIQIDAGTHKQMVAKYGYDMLYYLASDIVNGHMTLLIKIAQMM